MHLLESYSLNCGAKIDKPFIFTSYFPLPFERYVVFHSQGKIGSKNYYYWQDVINCVSPELEKNNIKIVHLGSADANKYTNVVNLCGQTNVNQTAYVLERSMLFFGCDGFESQLAGHFNVPIVSINSMSYANNTGPYFGNKESQVVFESFVRTNNKKASFNQNETPKSIDLIKPEEIANAILKLLKINFEMPFETVHSGTKYSYLSIQESIPNYKEQLFNPESIVEIRADIECDDESLSAQLSYYKKSFVVVDKPINLNILRHFKKNISMLVFKITEVDNRQFLSSVRELGIKTLLISRLPQDVINSLKILYYEYGTISKVTEASQGVVDSLRKDVDKLFYRSSKIVGSKGKYHYSLIAEMNSIPMNNGYEYQKVIDNELFWRDMEFFTIIKLK